MSARARLCGSSPSLVGDPIDVITGAVVDELWDFVFDGPRSVRKGGPGPAMRVEWWRAYDSRWFEEDRGLGYGFRHSYEHWLVFDLDGITYRTPRGHETHFPFLRDGERSLRGGYTLERLDAYRYRLSRYAEPVRLFHRPTLTAHDARLAEVHAEDDPSARVVLAYDEVTGRLDKILTRGPTGADETLKIEWNDEGRIARVVHWARDGARTPFVAYRYDERGCLDLATDMYKQRCRYAYTDERRLARKTDRRGYSYLYTYDAEGRCIASQGEDGTNAVHLSYKPFEYETTVLDANGGEWLYQYRPNGVLTYRTDPYGGKRFWKYGPDGRLLAEYDEEGCATRYLHDEAGAAIAKVTPDGKRSPIPEPSERTGHRVPRLPIEVELGDLWDPDFALPDALEPLPGVPAAVRASLITSEDPLRGTVREVRDLQGLLLREELEDGRARAYAYNENGGLRRITDFDGGAYKLEVESDNHITREVDPADNITSFVYSFSGEVTEVVDPSGTHTTYRRDLKDRITDVLREGHTRETYAYDHADRLIEKRDTNGERMFTLEWDRLGHLMTRSLMVGGDQSYRYDAHGRVTEIFTDNHHCTFAYDWRGRRIEDKRDGKGVSHYFSAERLQSTAVLDRFRTTYRHEADGSVVLVDPAGAEHRIRPHGRGVITRDFANGLSETTQYHPRGGRVLRRVLYERATGTPRWERRFEYSGEGDLLEVRDTDRGITRHEHDVAHRLAATVHPDGKRDTYQYNRAGSLFESPTLGQATVGQGNVLRYANGERFEYGGRHHLKKRVRHDSELTYDYDSRDQLSVVFWQSKTGKTWGWDAEYDGLGRRARKSPGYEHHHTYYWDTDRLAAEVLPDGRCRVYVYADAFAIVPMLFLDYESTDADPASGRRGYVLTDQRGCVERVLDDRGADLWRARVDPYGVAHIEVGQDFHQPLRFPGHYYDAELGLHYNRFRYYDPALGRYLETDPLGLRGGRNLYAYTNNPLTQLDVRGLETCPTSTAPAEEPEGEDRPDVEGEGTPGDIEALRAALADMHDEIDADILRHLAEEAGVDPRLVSDARVAHIDHAARERIADPSRRPSVVRNEEGVPTHAVVAHGPRSGEEVRIISGDEAGTTVDGVTRDEDGFVVLDSHYDTVLGDQHLGSGDEAAHFRAANESLANQLREDPGLADRIGLDDDQVSHLLREPPSSRPPPRLTWHHHQDTGRMQLVSADEHGAACPHTGGMAIWGGGYGD
ncbi:MAG: RHS repeat-associated core domain-containing protein [Sandaracinaceae bacterium]